MCMKIPKTGDEILLLHSTRDSALAGETTETEPKRRMKMIYNNRNITVTLLEILHLLELMVDRPGCHVNPLNPFLAGEEGKKVS